MDKLPNEIINNIMSYNSHPVADLMKALISKYNEVCCMRCKNPRCGYLSFFDTWYNIELDQGKIDIMLNCLKDLKYLNCPDFDF